MNNDCRHSAAANDVLTVTIVTILTEKVNSKFRLSYTNVMYGHVDRKLVRYLFDPVENAADGPRIRYLLVIFPKQVLSLDHRLCYASKKYRTIFLPAIRQHSVAWTFIFRSDCKIALLYRSLSSQQFVYLFWCAILYLFDGGFTFLNHVLFHSQFEISLLTQVNPHLINRTH